MGCRLSVLTALAFCLHLCSDECRQGVCAAHWAALQTLVQMLGGLAGCGGVLPHIITDLHTVCSTCSALLTDASLTALFSDALVQLAPRLAEVRSAAAVVGMVTRVDPVSISY